MAEVQHTVADETPQPVSGRACWTDEKLPPSPHRIAQLERRAAVLAWLIMFALPWSLRILAGVLFLTGVGIPVSIVLGAISYLIRPGKPVAVPAYPGRVIVDRED